MCVFIKISWTAGTIFSQIIEKTGHQDEILNLFSLLEPFEILEFARSGRVAISKPIKPLSAYLKEIEEQQK